MRSLPHARGGVSPDAFGFDGSGLSSPRPWGCFRQDGVHPAQKRVFPTPVGVFLGDAGGSILQRCLPHARGGVSFSEPFCDLQSVSSPRPWGCFQCCGSERMRATVFPTPVGVFPVMTAAYTVSVSLPHARGGVSGFPAVKNCHDLSSPRPWGCFLAGRQDFEGRAVFPTPVGVFLKSEFSVGSLASLPHARGGVSGPSSASATTEASSPRPWGCFAAALLCADWSSVFPTPVGVFPAGPVRAVSTAGLPHARGGVSATANTIKNTTASSPRPWGCFRDRPVRSPVAAVFPTPVGVFPVAPAIATALGGLPHARGGVSVRQYVATSCGMSSPRPWGCFFVTLAGEPAGKVFPTPVGVFPPSTTGKNAKPDRGLQDAE